MPSVPEGQQLFGETGPAALRSLLRRSWAWQSCQKCCFCLVAGGLGERLGFPGIKIGIVTEVITGTTFIELFCSYILACQSYARTDTGDSSLLLPLAIMTSGDTHDKTIHMMRENDAWISFRHVGSWPSHGCLGSCTADIFSQSQAFFGMVEEQARNGKQTTASCAFPGRCIF